MQAPRRRRTTIWEAATLGRVAEVQRYLAASEEGVRNSADVRDPGGWTPLMHAAVQGHHSLVRWLVESAGADPDLNDAGTQQRTALLHAAAAGKLKVVRVLLAFEAVDIDAQDARGCSALMLAAWNGHFEVVKELLVRGVRIDSRDLDAWTALTFAARFGRLDIAHLLLERGAQRDPASVSNDRTPLMHAVLMGHIEIARVLLDYGADATKTDRNGNSIVMLALQGDVMPRNNHQGLDAEEDARLGMVQMLVKHGAPASLSNLDGQSPRQLATEEGFSRIAAFLRLCQPSEMRMTPLLARHQTFHASVSASTEFFEAVEGGNVKEVLAQIDSMLDARDSHGLTPLLIAAKNDQLEVLQLCISRGANLSVRDDTTASSVLHFAASAGSSSAVRLLLSEGADIGMKDAKGLTPIDAAVASGFADIVEELYSSGATVRNISTIDRQTIWHRAVKSGSVDVVRFLVQLNCSKHTDQTDMAGLNSPPDVNALDRSGYSALHLACCSGMIEIVALLLSTGADPNVLCKAPRSEKTHEKEGTIEAEEEPTPQDKPMAKLSTSTQKESALHLSVRHGHYGVVELLLRKSNQTSATQVNILNDLYQTPLLVAVECGCSDIAALLLDAGADIEAAAPSGVSDEIDEIAGQTSLLVASRHGHEQLVKILLEYGARVDVMSAKGMTPIGVARSEPLRSVLSLYQSSQQFQQRCFALLHSNGNSTSNKPVWATSEELLELAALVTSAYDLRFLLTLSLRILDETRAKNLPTAGTEVGIIASLKRAFELILAKKLVFDDDACVFFRLALEQCSKRGLVSSRDYMRWKLEATKINMESADWVVDLKRQVYQNSWRAQTTAKNVEMLAHGIKQVHEMTLENREGVIACAQRLKQLEYQLEDANRIMATAMSQIHAEVAANTASIRETRDRLSNVDDRLEQFQQRLQQNEANIGEVASHLHQMQETQIASIQRQRKHQMMKHGFGLVASLVGFVFAPMLKEVFDTVLDLSDPLEIARCAISDTLGGGDGVDASDIMDLLLSTSNEEDEGDDIDEDKVDESSADANEAGEKKASSILKPAVQMLLAKFGIQSEEFTTALRQEIVVQHPELVSAREARGGIVILGTNDTEGVKTAMEHLEREQMNLAATLEEMRMYSQQIAAAQARTPTIVPMSPDLALDLLSIGDSSAEKVEDLRDKKVSDSPLRTSVTISDATTVDASIEESNLDRKPTETKTLPPEENQSGGKHVSSEERTVLELLEDISRFPFHDAVLQSGGDLSLFISATEPLLRLSQLSAAAAAETMTMAEIVYVGSTRTTITAAEYAYYLGFNAVGDLLVEKMCQQGMEMPSRPTQSVPIDVEADLADFPYHYAVFASNGDPDECEMLLEVVHEDDDPIDAQVPVKIHGGVRKSLGAMSAVDLASRLGYVDVVKHFLVKIRVKTAEKGVVLLHRAREQAKREPPRVVLLDDETQ